MRILLALDLSDHPEELVDRAFAWATLLGGTLDLLFVDEHAYSALAVQDPALHTLLTAEWGKIREAQKAHLASLAARLPARSRGEAAVREGRAAEEIVAAAQGHDVVLVTTHGRRGLPHLLLGSVAERVVRTSPIPVVVLPAAPSDR